MEKHDKKGEIESSVNDNEKCASNSIDRSQNSIINIISMFAALTIVFLPFLGNNKPKDKNLSTAIETSVEDDELTMNAFVSDNQNTTITQLQTKSYKYERILKSKLIKYEDRDGNIKYMTVFIKDNSFKSVIYDFLTNKKLYETHRYTSSIHTNLLMKEFINSNFGTLITYENFSKSIISKYGVQEQYTEVQVNELMKELQESLNQNSDLEKCTEDKQESTITVQASIASNYSDDDEATLTTGNLDNSANPTLTKNNK